MRFFLLGGLVALCAAQIVEDYCRRHQHQSCVIDDFLYIDGGLTFSGDEVNANSVTQPSKSQHGSRLLSQNDRM